MFPIGDDDVRGQGVPWLTILLILANVAVFILELSMGRGLQEFVVRWGAVPAHIANGERLETLVTSMFLHGGWVHIIGNMLFLWVFGDNIEATLGRIGFLLFYLIGGIVASGAHVLSALGSEIPSVGASGAIAAVMGAYVVMFPRSRVRVLLFLGFFLTTTRVTAIVFIGVWAVMQFFNGVASLGAETAQTAGVAYWAHIGGFVFGLLVGLLFRGRAEGLDLVRSGRRAPRGRFGW